MKGVTEEGVAKRLNISTSTLWAWKKKYIEFSSALKQNNNIVDDLVEGSLFKKAMAGDTTACIFWLKNRRTKEWRDKQNIEHSGKIDIKKDFSKMTDEELELLANGHKES